MMLPLVVTLTLLTLVTLIATLLCNILSNRNETFRVYVGYIG